MRERGLPFAGKVAIDRKKRRNRRNRHTGRLSLLNFRRETLDSFLCQNKITMIMAIFGPNPTDSTRRAILMGFWIQILCCLLGITAGMLPTPMTRHALAQHIDDASRLADGHSVAEGEIPGGEFPGRELPGRELPFPTSSVAQPCPEQSGSVRLLNQPRFVGTDRCVPCHKDGHRFAAYGVAGREYQVWADSDPHSRSYNTLFEEKSLSIAQKLHLGTAPHKNALCTNCHAPHALPGLTAEGCQPEPADSIGCESCHGPAEKWLVPHKFEQWKYLSREQKESLGYVNTDDFAARTGKCVQCHVGSEGRDVNHDLIAAGHPPLHFEMSAYQSRLPRHWSRSKELQTNTNAAEAKLWLTGQFVSAAAALELLKLRAANAQRPWPEFSEYACYSCHHSLDHSRPEQVEQNVFQHSVGKPTWGAWHFSVADPLSARLRSQWDLPVDGNLKQLRQVMQKTIPDRQLAFELSRLPGNNFNELANLVSQIPAAEQQIISLCSQFSGQGVDDDNPTWESLVQRYLAAVAVRQAILDSNGLDDYRGFDFARSRNQLTTIRELIRFAKKQDGPAGRQSRLGSEINRRIDEIFNPQTTRTP